MAVRVVLSFLPSEALRAMITDGLVPAPWPGDTNNGRRQCDHVRASYSLAPLVASPHASHPLSTRRLFAQRVFKDCTSADLSHDQRSRTLDREPVLHGPEARLWFAAPFDQAWELLSACFDGLRLASSPLRDIIDQCCLPARAAVGVLAANSLVPNEGVPVGPQGG